MANRRRQNREPKRKRKPTDENTDLAAINGVPIVVLKIESGGPSFRGAPTFGFVKSVHSAQREGERTKNTGHNSGDQEEIWRRVEANNCSIFDEIGRAVRDAAPVLFLTGDVGLQLSAVTELLYAVELAHGQKVSARNEGDCAQADFWLGEQSLLHAMAHLIEVWIDIKCGLPRRAWIHKVDSESYLRVSRCAMVSCGIAAAEDRMRRIGVFSTMLASMDNTVFPPLTFASTGFTYTSASCSVCHEDLSECPHIEGRVYCGKYCTKINLKDGAFDHFARVDEPYDRRSIFLSYVDGLVSRDELTGKVLKVDNDTLLATAHGRLTILPDIAN